MENTLSLNMHCKEAQSDFISQDKQLYYFNQIVTAKQEWETMMDCVSSIVLLSDKQGKIKRCNNALREFTGKDYKQILGRNWQGLLCEHSMDVETFHQGRLEIFHKVSGRWFVISSYECNCDFNDKQAGTVITIHDITEVKKVNQVLADKNEELKNTNEELKATQIRILQQEKMASIGQLAAGVAHEINNPIGFVSSNLHTLKKYTERLEKFIQSQAEVIEVFNEGEAIAKLKEKRKKLKLDYVLEDITELIEESLEGTDRVGKIVQDLKTFSRVDGAEYKYADINEHIEKTLNIVWNELKYKVSLTKEYGNIPHTKCYSQQLNQVFMNLLVNASHAIEKQGEISVKTWNKDGFIFISISDTGCGITEENKKRLFEPFFTTKEVGKGTGLGLSISYDIVKKHNGEITVKSEMGKGTTFIVKLPVVDEQ